MKKLTITACFLVFGILNYAQKSPKDSLVKLMSDEICLELNKSEKTDKKEDIEAKLGLLMMPTIIKHFESIQDIYKIKELNENSMYEVGKDIGLYMALKCDGFISLMSKNMSTDKEEIENRTSRIKKTNKITGTFLKTITADISYIEVKTITGKTEKLYWMGYFDGDDLLTNGFSGLVNKKVNVQF